MYLKKKKEEKNNHTVPTVIAQGFRPTVEALSIHPSLLRVLLTQIYTTQPCFLAPALPTLFWIININPSVSLFGILTTQPIQQQSPV